MDDKNSPYHDRQVSDSQSPATKDNGGKQPAGADELLGFGSGLNRPSSAEGDNAGENKVATSISDD